jgi:hypothetical protein
MIVVLCSIQIDLIPVVRHFQVQSGLNVIMPLTLSYVRPKTFNSYHLIEHKG